MHFIYKAKGLGRIYILFRYEDPENYYTIYWGTNKSNKAQICLKHVKDGKY